MSALILVLASVVMLSGCVMSHTGMAENPVTRNHRQSYLANTPTLTPAIRDAITAQRVIPGMSRADVMAAWGPPATCRRAYGDPTRDTVCLYTDHATILGGTRTYTDRRYKSVYFQNGVSVDWQWH